MSTQEVNRKTLDTGNKIIGTYEKIEYIKKEIYYLTSDELDKLYLKLKKRKERY